MDHLNHLKLKINDKTTFTLKATPFKRTEKDIRLQMWAPFWQAPSDPMANKAAADQGIKVMAGLNGLAGDWSQAKVTRSANKGVYFNWIPDETMFKDMEAKKDKDGKVFVNFPSWKYPIQMSIIDINEIRENKAKAKLEKVQKTEAEKKDHTTEENLDKGNGQVTLETVEDLEEDMDLDSPKKRVAEIVPTELFQYVGPFSKPTDSKKKKKEIGRAHV